MFDIDKKCPVCGKVSSHQVLGSTNTMDYPDLDLRPAEMQRSTMNTWLDECPHCGYVSGDFRNETSIDEEFLKSESYLTCDGIEFIFKMQEYHNFCKLWMNCTIGCTVFFN